MLAFKNAYLFCRVTLSRKFSGVNHSLSGPRDRLEFLQLFGLSWSTRSLLHLSTCCVTQMCSGAFASRLRSLSILPRSSPLPSSSRTLMPLWRRLQRTPCTLTSSLLPSTRSLMLTTMAAQVLVAHSAAHRLRRRRACPRTERTRQTTRPRRPSSAVRKIPRAPSRSCAQSCEVAAQPPRLSLRAPRSCARHQCRRGCSYSCWR